ncbi:MAG: DUF4157 domain-containing protein [Thermoanaerobaculia bacterium]
MTLLARRREEEEKPEPERRSVAMRPPQPRPSFLHLQSAIGNRATGDLLARELGSDKGPKGLQGQQGQEEAWLLRMLLVPGVPVRPFLIPDGAVPAPGQRTRNEFLAAMRDAAREAAEEGLAGTGHTARGCPWIEHYFRFYERQSAERIEADLLHYVPAARGVASADELLAAAAGHVRASVRRWAATGELTGVPRGLPGAGLVGALARELAAVQAQLGEGRPLESAVRGRMEQALGTPLGDVRLHTDPAAARLARSQDAPAFAVGRHVAFDQGEYRPGTPAGDALLAHELAHVAQQEGAEREAVGSGSRALEHDADGAAAGAVARLWARGRPLPAGLPRPAQPRLRSGLALQRCTPNSDRWFLPYQQRFNELWNQEPYKSKSAAFDPGLSNKGPRTERSRAIFERLYLEDAELREAYDGDKGGLRERIDTYTGPEGLNLINSPRLRALEQVFSRFHPPVSGRTYDRFKQEVATAAGALDEADRQAINVSNEWARQINRYVRGADQRREIQRLINPPVAPSEAPAAEGTPEDQLTQEQKIRRFFDRWRANLQFKRGLNEPFFFPATEVRYEGHGQLFRVHSSSAIANPGQVLYVRVRVSRGSTEIASPAPQLFPAGQSRMPPVIIPVREPATVPAEGDALVFVVELLEGDLTTVRGTPQRFEVTVQAEVALTQAAAEAVARADDTYMNDASPAGLLGRMRAQGGIPANVAQGITLRYLTFHALTERHDSGAYVERQLHHPDPAQVGYFVGPDYSKSFVEVPADAFSLHDFGPRFIVVNRTPDLRAPQVKRPEDTIIQLLVHEAVHAYDVRPNEDTPLERYKTEFRAYWMDGHLGPPLQGTCPTPPARCTDLGGSCLDTSFCAELPPPGPKTPRSRSIFNHLYGSPTYTFVRENYDENVHGFRQAVDQYVIPDGINLIASIWLSQLREIIAMYDGRDFDSLREKVLYWAAPPPQGRLNDEERAQVRGDRAWRDLVERHVRDTDQQRRIKRDLGIPS